MDLDYQNMKKKAMKDLQEFTPSQIAKLKKEYEPLRGKSITVSNSNKLRKMLQRMPKDNLKKLANANIPFLSSGAATQLVMKHGMKFTDFPKTSLFGEEMGELQQEACWTGYKQVGMKKKGDRMVPNCVPESVELDEADLTKRQVKMVHKAADKLDKKDFIKRYGKDGDSVRYATATNMIKKKLGIDEMLNIEEQRAKSSPEVAAAIRQYVAQRPFIMNKIDYDELQRLALKDMGMFNARLNRMNDDTKGRVQTALARKGLSSHLVNEKEPKGDKPMQEQSYKDKFNATMKDFGIKSLGDLKSDEEKKKFFKAVDAKHDAKNEAMNTAMDGGMSMPDMNLKAMKKMNAMKMSEPMKKMDSKGTEGGAKTDADMSKVKDKQKPLMAMMKKENLDEALPGGQQIIRVIPNKGDKESAQAMAFYTKQTGGQMGSYGVKPGTNFITLSVPTKRVAAAKRAMANKKFGQYSVKVVPSKYLDRFSEEVPAEPMKKLNTGEKMKEEAEPLTRDTMSLADKEPMNAMKMMAMKMPIRAMKQPMNAMKMKEMMKNEMMKEMKMEMAEMMKKEMMKDEMKMSEMMKKEMMKEMMKEMAEMMEMKMEMKKMEAMMLKAQKDPSQMEMMKKEMMKEMKMEMMKEMREAMMKKMEMMKKEMMKEYGSMMAMKKPMNAMKMKENKYLSTKSGSLQDVALQMHMREQELVEVKGDDIEKMITDYLKKGGTITKLPPALAKGMKQSDMQKHKVGQKGVIKSMKMKEVRDFVDTYNKHFLTNWAAEELLER